MHPLLSPATVPAVTSSSLDGLRSSSAAVIRDLHSLRKSSADIRHSRSSTVVSRSLSSCVHDVRCCPRGISTASMSHSSTFLFVQWLRYIFCGKDAVAVYTSLRSVLCNGRTSAKACLALFNPYNLSSTRLTFIGFFARFTPPLNTRRRHHVSRSSVRLSVNSYFARRNETCHEYSPPEWELLKWFSRSEVEGQGHDQTECYNDGGMHYDGAASRRARVRSSLISDACRRFILLSAISF